MSTSYTLNQLKSWVLPFARGGFSFANGMHSQDWIKFSLWIFTYAKISLKKWLDNYSLKACE